MKGLLRTGLMWGAIVAWSLTGGLPAQAKPKAKPSKPPAAIAEPVVTSKPDLDYERLQLLMKSGEWSEANRLTSNIVLTLGGQFERGYLTFEDIKQIPCGDLRLVDNLWRYYSKGRSGYTVQAQIWRRQGEKNIERFEDVTGWSARKLIPDPKSAQIGHLPNRPAGSGGDFEASEGAWIQGLTKQAEVCKMIPAKPVPKKKPVKVMKKS
ncbi:MAG: GUN4 domain-containing protein [Alkalinema sp. RU_4_3]|nr:GUN4 domain-containing protein [Alkalinema sp. RU_4_3]